MLRKFQIVICNMSYLLEFEGYELSCYDYYVEAVVQKSADN